MRKSKIITLLLIMLIISGCTANSINDKNEINQDPLTATKEPGITLCNYKEIEVPIEKTEITDEDINSYVNYAVDIYNMSMETERDIVKDGDIVFITAHLYDEYGGLLNSGIDEQFYVHIGEGVLYEGLEEGLIGLEKNIETDIPVKIPDLYEPNERISGLNVDCKVTVNAILDGGGFSANTLSDDDADKIIQANPLAIKGNTKQYVGINGIKEYAKACLQEQIDAEEKSQVFTFICEYLVSNCVVDPFPDSELENRINNYMTQTEQMCSTYYGMTLNEYYDQMGVTEQQFLADVKDRLSDAIKLELILKTIGDSENIEYDENGYQEYAASLLNDSYENIDALYETYSENYVRNSYQIDFVSDWLINNAKIVYTEPKENDENVSDFTVD